MWAGLRIRIFNYHCLVKFRSATKLVACTSEGVIGYQYVIAVNELLTVHVVCSKIHFSFSYICCMAFLHNKIMYSNNDMGSKGVNSNLHMLKVYSW